MGDYYYQEFPSHYYQEFPSYWGHHPGCRCHCHCHCCHCGHRPPVYTQPDTATQPEWVPPVQFGTYTTGLTTSPDMTILVTQ